jgi:hypothetical protein
MSDKEFPHTVVIDNPWKSCPLPVRCRLTKTQLVTKDGERYNLRTGLAVGHDDGWSNRSMLFDQTYTSQAVRDAHERAVADRGEKLRARFDERQEARRRANQAANEELAKRIVEAIMAEAVVLPAIMKPGLVRLVVQELERKG